MTLRLRQEGGRSIRLPLPTGLLLNRVTLRLILRYAGPRLGKAGISLSHSQLRLLAKALRRGRRQLAGQPLVQVWAADGDMITLYL